MTDKSFFPLQAVTSVQHTLRMVYRVNMNIKKSHALKFCVEISPDYDQIYIVVCVCVCVLGKMISIVHRFVVDKCLHMHFFNLPLKVKNT